MRVAFVSLETVYHRDSETNRRLQTIAELLHNRGHDVHFFCARFWEGGLPRFEREGITYHGVSVEREAQTGFLIRLPFELVKANPDIVHTGVEPPRQVLAARLGATVARAPTIVEWYGDEGVTDDRTTRRATGWANRIVVPSELVSTWVQELGAESTTIDVLPNPIDIERIKEVEPGENVDVVYARRLDADANLESLFLGLAELRTRDWQTTVIGDGPERDYYEQLASDLRIDDRITFVGECSREERIAIYRGAHVFAQTADYCVFPTEMLWALASGCVGIIEYHADSSAHELVEGWDRGFRTTSEEELADAIVAAGDLESRTVDDRFDSYDKRAVRDRYLTLYRTLQD